MASFPHITPPPPPTSPDDGPIVIIVIFVSFGCIFFLAFFMFALWCLIKKRKKKTVEVEETDVIRTDKHRKVKEAIVQGPHGPQVVVLSIEEDKHTQKQIIKNEKVEEKKQMHAKSGELIATDHIEAGESSSSNNPSIINPRVSFNVLTFTFHYFGSLSSSFAAFLASR
ncbi:hypothetical protein DH2020_007275 [Rehmannia glutinosa]|uniref:Uncharacterized protein n=1 Tax=Rehmannia glutinosa TaxID=99300 RepID=A0ABR0TY69_REHGL